MPSDQLAALGAAGLRMLFELKMGLFAPTVCPDCEGSGTAWYTVRRADAEVAA